jgi:hypothetical protein
MQAFFSTAPLTAQAETPSQALTTIRSQATTAIGNIVNEITSGTSSTIGPSRPQTPPDAQSALNLVRNAHFHHHWLIHCGAGD